MRNATGRRNTDPELCSSRIFSKLVRGWVWNEKCTHNNPTDVLISFFCSQAGIWTTKEKEAVKWAWHTGFEIRLALAMVERSTSSMQENQHVLNNFQISTNQNTWQAICPPGIKSIVPTQGQLCFFTKCAWVEDDSGQQNWQFAPKQRLETQGSVQRGNGDLGYQRTRWDRWLDYRCWLLRWNLSKVLRLRWEAGGFLQ